MSSARTFDWLAPSPAADPGDWNQLSDNEQAAVEWLGEFEAGGVWTGATQILDGETLMLNARTASALKRKGWVCLDTEQVEDGWWVRTATSALLSTEKMVVPS